MKQLKQLLSALQVKKYFIESFNFDITPKILYAKNGLASNHPIFSLEHKIRKSPAGKEFLVSLFIEFNKDIPKDKRPYNLAIILTGIFEFSDELSKEQTDSMLLYNAIPLLYTTARPLIKDFTENTPVGGILIPTLNFKEYFKDKLVATKKKGKPIRAKQTKGTIW